MLSIKSVHSSGELNTDSQAATSAQQYSPPDAYKPEPVAGQSQQGLELHPAMVINVVAKIKMIAVCFIVKIAFEVRTMNLMNYFSKEGNRILHRKPQLVVFPNLW